MPPPLPPAVLPTIRRAAHVEPRILGVDPASRGVGGAAGDRAVDHLGAVDLLEVDATAGEAGVVGVPRDDGIPQREVIDEVALDRALVDVLDRQALELDVDVLRLKRFVAAIVVPPPVPRTVSTSAPGPSITVSYFGVIGPVLVVIVPVTFGRR